MNTLTEQNYLKAIYKLSNGSDHDIYTNDIAHELNTTAASVTDMLKKLSDKKFIRYQKYQGVSLTNKGREVAVEIVRRHRMWEYFLVKKLNFNWDEIHEIAEELEHINSTLLIDRLEKFLDHPKFDPHGDPIPNHKGKILQLKTVKLSELKIQESGAVVGVMEQSPGFLKFLDKLKINLGSKISVIEQYDFDKSLKINIDKKNSVNVSFSVAQNILIAK